MANQLTFLGVNTAEGMDIYQASGFIGLAPVSSDYYDLPSFVTQQQADDGVENLSPVFSIFLSDNFLYDGRIIFGDYNMAYAEDGLTDSDIAWLDLAPNNFYWTVNIGDILFDNTPDSIVSLDSQYLIFDTGTTYSQIP